MTRKENKTLQVMVSLRHGLVDDVQVFRSATSAQQMWDASINEAQKSVGYENLSPEEQRKFDQDPFGFAYEDIDLIWEETTLKD
jgi:hypothetical protein